METPAEKARRLNAARLEKSGRAVSVRNVVRGIPEPSRLEWWQRERQPPKGPPGAPKPPSSKQWRKLAFELSHELELMDAGTGEILTKQQFPSRSEVLSWVRFANAGWPGPYTSLHFVTAIDLAVRGRNLYGTVDQLIEFSEGKDLPPPDTRGHYAHLKKGAGPKTDPQVQTLFPLN